MEQVLDATGIEASDNFCQMGGTSPQAAVLITRIGELFATRPDLETFLRRPTVAGLAEWIHAQPGAATPTGAASR